MAFACAYFLLFGSVYAFDIEFNRDIRPILSDKCFQCHGPDSGHREGNLRFDVREAAIGNGDSGQAAIVPGKPEESELVRRIRATDDAQMPPASSHKKLKPSEIDLLERWIREGAIYDAHWSFLPRRPGDLSKVERSRVIDTAIAKQLRQQSQELSPWATPETWLRRIAFDLNGLPPTADERLRFLKEVDTNPDAWISNGDKIRERWIDYYLSQDAYGETMAVDWLDAARYADTGGYPVDRERSAFAYRDWVISALNANMRFDQFTLEQIAGDLLPNATPSQRIATAFLRLHPVNEEGGVLNDEFLAEYTADRVETVTGTWLGQTFNCVRCHDHKFDPFTQRDFYSFKAFFNNVDEQGAPDNGDPTYVSFSPVEFVDSNEQQMQVAQWKASLVELEKQFDAPGDLPLDAKRIEPAQWRSLPLEKAYGSSNSVTTAMVGNEVTVGPLRDGKQRVLFAIDKQEKPIRWIKINTICRESDLRVIWNDVGLVMEGTSQHQLFAVDGQGAILESESRKLVDASISTGVSYQLQSGVPSSVWFEAVPPLPSSVAFRIELQLESADAVSHWSFEVADESREVQAELDTNQQSLALWKQSEAYRQLLTKHAALTKQWYGRMVSRPYVPVMQEMDKPRDTFILQRGAYDSPGERVTPNTPACLPPMRADWPRNRLGLARWLVDPENPLTSRVMVNRLWQRFFGVGLVKTSEDFGSQGSVPSHPELLDWLAEETIRCGWNTKAIVKLMVASQAYGQSSRISDKARETDPDNKWLSHAPRLRLPAEMIRDSALAVSEQLVRTLGGESVRPYHPKGIYEQVVANPSTRYIEGTGDALYRRSLYTFWKRSVPHPAMVAFDASTREVCTLKRPRTNTPAQALNLMNDPTYIESARELAKRLLKLSYPSEDAMLQDLFERSVGRSPSQQELSIMRRTLHDARLDWKDDEKERDAWLSIGTKPIDTSIDRTELASLSMVVHTVFCLDEFITRN